jgi:hypothetical protein
MSSAPTSYSNPGRNNALHSMRLEIVGIQRSLYRMVQNNVDLFRPLFRPLVGSGRSYLRYWCVVMDICGLQNVNFHVFVCLFKVCLGHAERKKYEKRCGKREGKAFFKDKENR